MKNAQKAAGETASQGFYWKHEWMAPLNTMTAAKLGYLLRLIDEFVDGTIDFTELDLADPEVYIAFHFICNDIMRV